jgi:hypothetical protein
MTPLRIFIGYDSREPIALSVAAHSISRRASGPVTFIPLALPHLKGIYTREPNGTTEFSLTRFLVPYLSGYEGVSIFMDCDFLVKCDIYEVLEHIDLASDVSVCQHDYTPREGLKATGVQTIYARKNWSSFMVFLNDRHAGRSTPHGLGEWRGCAAAGLQLAGGRIRRQPRRPHPTLHPRDAVLQRLQSL